MIGFSVRVYLEPVDEFSTMLPWLASYRAGIVNKEKKWNCFSWLKSWIVPPKGLSIREQAEKKGVGVPFGKTAKDLRGDHWYVDSDVKDVAMLREDVRSPTGIVWMMPVWCVGSGFVNPEWALAH